MASISSLSGSTNNAMSSLRGYGGLASGLDRDELIAGMTSGTQTKITKQEQANIVLKEIIKFIKNSKWKILRNPNAPKRDKIAILLLSISAATYKYIWLSYRNSIMGGQFK